MKQSGPEGKGHQQNVSCKGQSITIGDGRQKPARQQKGGGLRRSLQYEKERGDGREMWKKDEGRSGKTARGAGLYSLKKAAGGAMPGALPEEATPNPTGPRLAWKQERAGISPGRRLYLIREKLVYSRCSEEYNYRKYIIKTLKYAIYKESYKI